mgnify:CR=1 FL=1
MPKKTFDCIELQHQGGARIRAVTKDMTAEEQIAYWKTRTEKLRQLQREVRGKRKSA